MRTTLQLLIILFFSQILLGQPANDLCSNAEVISCGDTIASTITGSTLDADMPNCFYVSSSSIDVWYQIAGTGEIISLDLTSVVYDFDVMVYQGDCTSLICKSNGANTESINFLGETGLTYRLRILGQSNDDNFTFSVQCQPPLINDSCQSATSISFGDTIFANTKIALSEGLSGNFCSSSDGPGLWYSVVGTGTNVGYNLIDGQGNVLDVYNSNCAQLECISRIPLGEYSKYQTVFLEKDSTYLLHVNRRHYEQGIASIFRLDTFEIAVNDLCEDALTLSCGDTIQADSRNIIPDQQFHKDVWYSFVGNDEAVRCEFSTVQNTQIQIYREGCPINGTPEFSASQDFSFFAHQGVEYRISVEPQYNQGPFSIEWHCFTPVTNNFCGDPQSLSCGGLVNVDFSAATADTSTISYCSGSNNPLNRDLWYSFQGDGKTHSINHLQGYPNPTIEVYDSPCGSPCLSADWNLSYSEPFFMEVGKTYHIRFSIPHYATAPDEIFLEFNCLDPEPNDFCFDAITLETQINYTVNLPYATHDEIPQCSVNEPGLWYKIWGNGMVHEIRSTSRFRAFLFRGACNNLLCSTEFNDQYRRNYRFRSEPGEIYYIMIGDRHSAFHLTYHTYAAAENGECSNALPIACGASIQGDLRQAYSDSTYLDCHSGPSAGLWYKITGTGQILEFDRISGNSDTEVLVLADQNCSSTANECVSTGVVRAQKSFLFYAADGVEYSLLFSDIDDIALPFTIGVNCVDPNDNFSCGGATPIFGDTTITSNWPYFVNREFTTSCGMMTASSWYVIDGNNQWVDVTSNDGSNYIYSGDCSSLSCITNFYNNYRFFAKAGSTYYVTKQWEAYNNNSFTLDFQFADPPCELIQNFDNLYLPDQYSSAPNGAYRASSTISAQNTYLSTEADFIWQAGDSILLGPNFTMEHGALLELNIEDCVIDGQQ